MEGGGVVVDVSQVDWEKPFVGVDLGCQEGNVLFGCGEECVERIFLHGGIFLEN